MAIKITDNFQVNIKNPIDNRFVVGSQSISGGVGSIYPTPFYAYRDDISSNIGFVYPGLRIWDFNDNLPYVWTGVTWSNENVSGASVFDSVNPSFSTNGGYRNYITKFYDTGTVLSKSLLFDDNSHVSLGTITPTIINDVAGVNPNGPASLLGGPGLSAASISQGLHVQGRIRTNNGFVGIGTYITDINASNINSGYLNLLRISTNGANYGDIITYDNITGNPKWINPSGVSSGSANNSANSTVTDDTSSINKYITFVDNTGSVPIKVSLSKLQFKPSNGQLFLGNGSATEPVYSFLNSVNTGIYYNYDINFTKQGNNVVSIIDNGIAVKSPQYPQISFIDTASNKNRLLWVSSNDDLLFRTDTTNTLTDKRVWHQDNLFTLKAIATNQTVETARNLNISLRNAGTNDLIKGVYTYNVYNTTIVPSSQTHWSVLSFGRGDEGSVQLASNWFSNINLANPGTVYAERDILLRSLRDTTESWSPWVKIWNSGNSGYVPFGAILMWSGLTTQIPTGWRLCDGSAAVTILPGSVPGQPSMTSITIPDLRERFVVGAGIATNKLVFNYGTNFTLYIPTANVPGTYTFDVDIITPYYIDTVGRLRSGVNTTDGFRYHLYRGTNTNPGMAGFLYMIYDNRYGAYEVIQGAFPVVAASVTGTVKWMGERKGGTSYYTIDSAYPLNNDTYLRYDKYFTNGRRVAFTEIVWPTIQSSGYATGDKGGFDSIVLEGSQMVKHQHDTDMGEKDGYENHYGTVGNNDNPGARDDDNKHYLSSAYGNNQPIENRPPYYALAFIIYTGI